MCVRHVLFLSNCLYVIELSVCFLCIMLVISEINCIGSCFGLNSLIMNFSGVGLYMQSLNVIINKFFSSYDIF